MTADETLNELLVCLFKDLTEIEGRCLITDGIKAVCAEYLFMQQRLC